MDINLLPIINADGKSLSFDTELDFSERSGAGVIFLSPIKVSGRFSNIGGTIELEASGEAVIGLECDRCLEEYRLSFPFTVSELLKKEAVHGEEDNNPDVYFFKGNSVELDGIVFDSLYTALPVKRLCREDCRGICAVCGKNLNEESCECDKEAVDPRFDVLDKFFE